MSFNHRGEVSCWDEPEGYDQIIEWGRKAGMSPAELTAYCDYSLAVKLESVKDIATAKDLVIMVLPDEPQCLYNYNIEKAIGMLDISSEFVFADCFEFPGYLEIWHGSEPVTYFLGTIEYPIVGLSKELTSIVEESDSIEEFMSEMRAPIKSAPPVKVPRGIIGRLHALVAWINGKGAKPKGQYYSESPFAFVGRFLAKLVARDKKRERRQRILGCFNCEHQSGEKTVAAAIRSVVRSERAKTAVKQTEDKKKKNPCSQETKTPVKVKNGPISDVEYRKAVWKVIPKEERARIVREARAKQFGYEHESGEALNIASKGLMAVGGLVCLKSVFSSFFGFFKRTKDSLGDIEDILKITRKAVRSTIDRIGKPLAFIAFVLVLKYGIGKYKGTFFVKALLGIGIARLLFGLFQYVVPSSFEKHFKTQHESAGAFPVGMILTAMACISGLPSGVLRSFTSFVNSSTMFGKLAESSGDFFDMITCFLRDLVNNISTCVLRRGPVFDMTERRKFEKWCLEVQLIITKFQVSDSVLTPELNRVIDKKFFELDAYTVYFRTSANILARLAGYRLNLVTIKNTIGGALMSTTVRPEPVMLVLGGDPGIGKTKLIPLIARAFLLASGKIRSDMDAKAKREAYDSHVFQKSDSPYWEGYLGQEVFLIDDFMQKRDVAASDTSSIMDIIRIINSNPLPLNMASLNVKGKVYFTSNFVLATTNILDASTLIDNQILSKKAFERRCEETYWLSLDANWATPGGKLDWNKYVTALRCKTISAFEPWTVKKYSLVGGAISGPSIPLQDVINRACALHKQKLGSVSEIYDLLPLVDEEVFSRTAMPAQDETRIGLQGIELQANDVEITVEGEDFVLLEPILPPVEETPEPRIPDSLLTDYAIDVKSWDGTDGLVCKSNITCWEAIAVLDLDVPVPRYIETVLRTHYVNETLDTKWRFLATCRFILQWGCYRTACLRLVRELLLGKAKQDNAIFEDDADFMYDDELFTRYFEACADRNLLARVKRIAGGMHVYDLHLFVTAPRFYVEGHFVCGSPIFRAITPRVSVNGSSIDKDEVPKALLDEIASSFGDDFDYARTEQTAFAKFWGWKHRDSLLIFVAVSSIAAVFYTLNKKERAEQAAKEAESEDVEHEAYHSYKSVGNKGGKVDRKNRADVRSGVMRQERVQHEAEEQDESGGVKHSGARVEMLKHAEAKCSSIEGPMNKVLRNTYKVFRIKSSGEVTSPGSGMFLRRDVFIYPFHFFDDWQREMRHDPKSGDFTVRLVNVVDKTDILEFTREEFMVGAGYDFDKAKDLAMVRLGLTRHYGDIVQQVISRDRVIEFDNKTECALFSFRDSTPTNIVSQQHAGRFFPNQYKPVLVAGSRSHQAIYDNKTKRGDCGTPIFAYTTAFQNRVLVGMHSARDMGVDRGMSPVLVASELEQMILGLGLRKVVNMQSGCSQEILFLGGIRMGDVAGATITQAEPSENFTVVGCVVPGVSASSQSKIRRSPFADSGLFEQLVEEDRRPAYLGPVTKEGVLVYPALKAMSTYGTANKQLDKVEVAQATIEAMRAFTHDTKDLTRRILLYEEAVAGVPDMNLHGIPRDTSPGFPYSLHHKNGKKDFLGYGEEYDFTSKDALWLRDRVDRLEQELREGERPLFVFQDQLKDELRGEEKVEAVKTRAISGAPIDYSILVRKYFGAFQSAFFERRVHNGNAPGMNVFREWGKLVRHLKAKNESLYFDGDFKGLDGSEMVDVHWAILEYINEWYDDEHCAVRRLLWCEVVNSYHVGGKQAPYQDFYFWDHCLPSGHPLTTIINTMYVLIAFAHAFLRARALHPLRFKKYHMFDLMHVLVYGDDNIGAVREEFMDVLNPEFFRSVFAEWGLTYTPADKNSNKFDFKPLEECTFLKRGFRYDTEYGDWFGPLNLQSALCTIFWEKSGRARTNDELVLVVETILAEAALHGDFVFEEVKQDLTGLCIDLGMPIVNVTRGDCIAMTDEFEFGGSL